MFPPYRGQKIDFFRQIYGGSLPKEKTMLFQIAVTHKKEENKLESIVVEVQSIIAKDAESAKRKAIKLVPADTDLDEVTVLVRPFV